MYRLSVGRRLPEAYNEGFMAPPVMPPPAPFRLPLSPGCCGGAPPRAESKNSGVPRTRSSSNTSLSSLRSVRRTDEPCSPMMRLRKSVTPSPVASVAPTRRIWSPTRMRPVRSAEPRGTTCFTITTEESLCSPRSRPTPACSVRTTAASARTRARILIWMRGPWRGRGGRGRAKQGKALVQAGLGGSSRTWLDADCVAGSVHRPAVKRHVVLRASRPRPDPPTENDGALGIKWIDFFFS